VAVRLERLGASGWRVEVADHGRGLPPGFNPAASRGLGMRIAAAMARRLGGVLEVDRASPGARFLVTIPQRP
jgi:two-component sensor histidine kinase